MKMLPNAMLSNALSSPRFGAHYLLNAEVQRFAARMNQEAVAKLYESFKADGEDCLILSRNAAALKALNVPEADVIDNGPVGVHENEVAVMLTGDDRAAFQKGYTVFERAGLAKSYVNSWMEKTGAQMFLIPKKDTPKP